VTVRKTVHGPVIEREGAQVAVAWTGLSASDTTRSVYEMVHSDGLDDFVAALHSFDEPTQNVVYADRDGNTLYYVTGKIPIRTVDGEEVRGDRVFDGSAGEAEWEGFTPYGTSTWEGFIPFDEKPGVVDPGYVATANQRVTDDPTHYIGQEFSPPFRGMRIYERLDTDTAAGTVSPIQMKDIQADRLDERAELLVPRLLSVREQAADAAQPHLDALAEWNYWMNVESHAATIFAEWFDAYEQALYADAYDQAGVSADHYPNDWITATISADSPWFDVVGTPESPAAAMISAIESVADDHAVADTQVYGEFNELAIDHPFDQPFLNYPRMPIGGSSATVKNYRKAADVGSSWRMVVPMDGDASVVLPGGNDGNPFSEHYHDQLRDWARGRYLPFDREWPDAPTIEFHGGSDR